MQTLYQEQLDEIDLYQNYKALLDAILNPKPKQVHSRPFSSKEEFRVHEKNLWHTKYKFERAMKRGWTFRKRADQLAYINYLKCRK